MNKSVPINLFCTTPILSVVNNSATWFSENKEVDLSISKNCSTSTFFKENFEAKNVLDKSTSSSLAKISSM